MVHVGSVIEIEAPPERVREVFLDFPNLPQWTTFFKSITVVGPKQPMELAKGDNVKVDFGNMTMTAPIEANTPRLFKWAGGMWWLFLGVHSFSFEPSKTTPGGTTFTNSEEFTGPMSFTMLKMKPFFGQQTETNFEKVCHDLKKRVESLEAAKSGAQ